MTRWYIDKPWDVKRKYHNNPTYIDGLRFDSKMEADYYCQLKLLKMAGKITEIERQVRFNLLPDFTYQGENVKGIDYVADFVITYPNGKKEVIDVKGVATDVYTIKKKLLMAKYPDINFREVKRNEIY